MLALYTESSLNCGRFPEFGCVGITLPTVQLNSAAAAATADAVT